MTMIMIGQVTVIFHQDNLLGAPLYVGELYIVPRKGEYVSLPGGNVGQVISVGWEIKSDKKVFVSITLSLI